MRNPMFPRPAAVVLAASLATSGVAGGPPAQPSFEIKEMAASCRLLPAELRQREATLLADLRQRIVRASPLMDGYALELTPDDANLKLAAEVIAIERQCCPFLQFRLTLAQESRALVLELRGPSGSREMLAQVLQLEATQR